MSFPIPCTLTSSPALHAAGQAMGELAVAGCIGATCVRKGLLEQATIKALSKTTYTILLPMFLGTTIMKSVTSGGGSSSSSHSNNLTILPILAVFQSLILYVLSNSLLLPLFGIDPHSDSGRTMAVTCSFGNAGVLPFMFVETLFRYDPNILQKAYACVSFFSVGWSPFFWSFGRHVLIGEKTAKQDQVVTWNTANNISKNNCHDDGNNNKSVLKEQIKKRLSTFLPPPVIGIMTGLFIAISPLSSLLLTATTKEGSKKTPPLQVIYNSFQNLGRAANPLGLLVLTSSLAMGARNHNYNSNSKLSNQNKKIHNYRRNNYDNHLLSPSSSSTGGAVSSSSRGLQEWSCVAVARFIMSPLLMLAMLHILSRVALIESFHEGAGSAMVWFILLLESIMPPAQNSVLMLQVAGRGQEASKMAKFLFSIYASAMIPMVIIITISLQLFGLVGK